MKRFFIILFVIFGYSAFLGANDLTHENIERRLNQNNARINHPKHSKSPKTWVDRGILFQDIFDVNIQFLYFGMAESELTLFMGEPNQTKTEETEFGPKKVLVYDNIEIHFRDGVLVSYDELKVIHEDPLNEAYSAFQKAIQLEKEVELGFFQKLFAGNQERKIKDAFIRLYGQFINHAVLNYEKQDFEKAFESFRMGIVVADSPYFEEPVETGILFNTGFVASLAGNHEEALEFFNRAKETGYSEGNIYVLMKNTYLELGDSLSAEKILQEGFQAYPQDNAILIELVNYYIVAENTKAALDYLQLAKKQEPDNPSFYYAEGTLHERLKEPEKAMDAYLSALEIDPDYYEVNFNMGVMHYNKAVAMLDEANKLTDNIEYMKARDAAFEVLGQSVPYLEKAHEVNPDDEDTMETLRILYYRLEMPEKLKEMYEKLGREFDMQP